MLVLVAACDGGALQCRIVPTDLLDAIGISDAAAVRAPEREAVWFISTAEGATWLKYGEVLGVGGGLILPVNSLARQTSEMGVDVAPGAPVFHGIDKFEPGVRESQECARD